MWYYKKEVFFVKLISFIISLILLSSGFSASADNPATENYAGPKERICASEYSSPDAFASLYGLTADAETVKSVSTSNSDKAGYYFNAEVNSDGSISYNGSTGVPKREYAVYISASAPSLTNTQTSDSNGKYSGSIAKNKIPFGISYIWILYKDTASEYYYYEFDLIPVIKNEEGVGIYKSEVFSSNEKHFNDYINTDLEYYKKINKYCLTEEGEHYFAEYNEITDKAEEITKGKSTAYDKALAVHDWLCENLHYDYDALDADNIEDAANPRLAFKTKKAVCSGFSRLMSIMLRSVGVPCIDVTGYANTFNAGVSWDDIDHSGLNHEWNMFHDGERWCMVDVTWDCTNKFFKNEFIKSTPTRTYFDASQTFFSYTHEVHEYYRIRNEYYSRFDYPAFDGVVYREDEGGDSFIAYEAYGDFEEYIIKSEVLSLPVRKVDSYFLYEHKDVKHVSVPSSVKEIGDFAFFDCDDLEVFEYPGDTLSIGGSVLYDCDDLTIYAKYNSDLYKYAKSKYIRVKILGKPKVSKIEKNSSGGYEVYYSYVSRAPEEKIFCIVKDNDGNLKEIKIFNLDYNNDHVTFNPVSTGEVKAYIFDKTLEP